MAKDAAILAARETGGRSPCPLCHGRTLEESAYAYLLGLYLGDGHIVSTKRGVFKLSIFQDQRYPGIIRECANAMSRVRPGGRAPNGRSRDGAVEIYSYWKHWSCLFPQHGPGRKHQRLIRLSTWQEVIALHHPEALIRGLIHSDGCRALNTVKGHVYPRYQFSNRSADIRAIFCEACDRLDVAWRRSNTFVISVSRRESVARLESIVGPKH
jgi:hypothetical protein